MSIQLRQRRRERQGGFSLIELLVVISIILVILFFAVPKMLGVIAGAHEAGAIKALQTINSEQIVYNGLFHKYANTLAQLGPPSTKGAMGPDGADLIQESLAAGQASDYLFTMTATAGGYTVSAVPKTPSSGRRTFFMDESGVIRQNWGQEPATATSPSVDAAQK